MRLIIPVLYRTGESEVVDLADATAPARGPRFAAAFGRPLSELNASERARLFRDASVPDGDELGPSSSPEQVPRALTVVELQAKLEMDAGRLQRGREDLARTPSRDAMAVLPDRSSFSAKIQSCLAVSGADGNSVAILIVDVEKLETTNDILGYAVDEDMFCQIAQRVVTAVGDQDFVARLGSDKFAIVQAPSGRQAAEALAERITRCAAEPVVINGQQIHLALRISVAVTPDAGVARDHLIDSAYSALDRAKREEGAHGRFVEPEPMVAVKRAVG
jgi:diguanylate cyclase (GGDEF)-like protein